MGMDQDDTGPIPSPPFYVQPKRKQTSHQTGRLGHRARLRLPRPSFFGRTYSVLNLSVAVVGCIAALLGVPEVRSWLSLQDDPRIPRFIGWVDVEEASAFTDFIHGHTEQIVYVDVWIPEYAISDPDAPSRGDNMSPSRGDNMSMSLYAYCGPPLEPEQHPTNPVQCSITWLKIYMDPVEGDHTFYCIHSSCKWRGYYKIVDFTEPYGRRRSVTLRPVLLENVR